MGDEEDRDPFKGFDPLKSATGAAAAWENVAQQAKRRYIENFGHRTPIVFERVLETIAYFGRQYRQAMGREAASFDELLAWAEEREQQEREAEERDQKNRER